MNPKSMERKIAYVIPVGFPQTTLILKALNHFWPCQVWRGNNEEDAALLATGCGNSAPDPVVAPNNVITTVFQSQDAPAPGFSASFTSSK